MRKRVAIIAACAMLVMCGVIIFITVNTSHSAYVEEEINNLNMLCRMSGEYLDLAALVCEDGDIEAWVKKTANENGVGIAVAGPDGTVRYAMRANLSAGADISGDLEVAAARELGAGVDRRSSYLGDTVFSAVTTGDGSIVRLSRKVLSPMDALSGRLFLIVCLALGFSLIIYFIVSWSVSVAHLNFLRVSQLLEAFAEGRFEERILGVPGMSKHEVERVNATANRIEDQLLRQSRRNQAISAVMNQMQNGILAVDEQMRIILVTPVAKKLLSITGNVDGVSIMDASKDVHIETVFQEAMQQDGVYTREVAVRSGDSGRAHTPVRLYVSAMRESGVAVGALALVEDITELKRLEQVRNDFVANVSHELKTPLTSIRGFVETLQAGAIENPEMANKFLRIIMLETERLTRLINDILVITKLESGADEAPLSRIRLDKMADDVVEMLEIHAGEKQVAVKVKHGGDPAYVWGNSDRVEQMLINLIENGIKYNQAGGSVTVSVFTSEDNVQLLVSDTGIGIAEEHLTRLFERFYRVDKGRSRNMGGTGLGLAIVKHIIRGMGGMIEVHSKIGEGTEFLVTLPRYNGELPETFDGGMDDIDED